MQGIGTLLTADLNDSQKAAVTHGEGAAVVFAGPGSGKTTVLTRRVLYLLEQGVSPERLMVVTFTRAAAREMESRLTQAAGRPLNGLWIGTFHSLFLSLLRRSGRSVPRLLKETEQTQWLRQLLIERERPADDEAVSTLLNQIGLCKGNLILPERLKVKKEKNILFRDLYQAYESRKRMSGVWDYDDILVETYRLLQDPRHQSVWCGYWEHILVDEFQDINRVQFETLRMLAPPSGNLFVVGDDDQAIYSFRGSDPRLMQEVRTWFSPCRTIVLSTNYRSTESVIALGQRLIRHNRRRQEKTMNGTGKQGPDPVWMEPADEEEEARQILARLDDGVETAVLYRTSTQARALIDALVRADVPFAVAEGDASFYRRWQVLDVMAYLRLADNPNDWDALVRIINKPKRYLFGEDWMDQVWTISRKTGQSLIQALADLSGLEPYQRRLLQKLAADVAALRGMNASQAVAHIREQIGYDAFLSSFARETGNDESAVKEPVEELAVAATQFSSRDELLGHVTKVNEVVSHQPEQPRVHLMTFHRAKGLEFDRVFLIGLHSMVLPHRRSLQVPEHKKAEAWEEERRLLYVGITRARRELFLSVSRTRQGKRVAPSPFLREMGFADGVDRKEGSDTEQKRRPSVSVPASSSRRPQPQQKFHGEAVRVGDRIRHVKWGEGEVVEVAPIGGVAPGRKVVIRFATGVQSLHYELSRQLGLLLPEE